ncbi:MAG: universal stress protein [Cyclobacteriaceae bacterium]
MKKILVGLDATQMDEALIEFASFLAHAASAESVQFINVIKNSQLPSALQKEFPNLMESAIVDRRKQLEKKVIEHFDMTNTDIKVKITVEQGMLPSKHILKLAEKHNIDAIVVGRKQNLKGSSVVTQRLARRATCSLLIVPEREYKVMSRIMVATDFSKESREALEEAIAVAKRSRHEGKDVEILLHHVYQVPVGYHYTGKSFEECSDVMCQNAQRNYDKFISKVDTQGLKITPIFSLDRNDNPVAKIYEKAVEENVDCIAIGGKGKAASTAFFPIGTNTEKLISMDATIPLLIVRPKHKNAGLMEMLQRI